MNRLHSYLLRAALLCVVPCNAYAQSIELQAITDFVNLDSGEVPYYVEIAGERNALAINAADPALRDKFARAEHVFTGTDGLYDITINALGEIDGEGTYRLLVNGAIQGELVNTPVSVDYTVVEHLFQAVALNNQDVVAVESKAVSNDMIPEGEGFAFARGRWRSVVMDVHTAEETTPDTSIDLQLALTPIASVVTDGAQVAFVVNITNNAAENTATAPIVNFTLADEITFISSNDCVATQEGVQCALPNLAPEQTTSARFNADISGNGTIELSVSVSADQIDNNIANNSAAVTFETVAIAQMSIPIEMQTEPTVPNAPDLTQPIDATASIENNETTTADDVSRNSGSAGILGLLALMLFGVFRVNRYA